ncbi:DUF742 domain-containing protein [Saccharopolyspora endophytica]|uniref:DUF742 domain-containing protein n=1 Tax=Saccharopolyspora endophytica TaxID=543886 RepID=A0ABS5D9Y1_9PSEU|nr:DUF742 domain-containing protein [Saccharopolyspora endophytica]MBQ0923101.1 DUF742 domain-containing protein [Saccharopolyspora endophytica]
MTNVDDDDPLVPAYAIADGRTREADGDLDIATLVELHPEVSTTQLSREYRLIAETLRRHGRLSVVEIAGHLGWPVVSVVALVTDLRRWNRIIFHAPELFTAQERPSLDLLERVRFGLLKL